MNQKKIIPAVRTDNITYAVRDIVVLANEVAKSGKEMLYLNIGDPNLYDFQATGTSCESNLRSNDKKL